jgi:hypothetical protein
MESGGARGSGFSFDESHHDEKRNLLDGTPSVDAKKAGRRIALLSEVSLKAGHIYTPTCSGEMPNGGG